MTPLLITLLAQATPEPGVSADFWVEAIKTLGFPIVVVIVLVYGIAKGKIIPGVIYEREVAKRELAEANERALEKQVREDIVPLIVQATASGASVVQVLADIRAFLATPPPPPRRKAAGT